jgi:two-component system response regulator
MRQTSVAESHPLVVLIEDHTPDVFLIKEALRVNEVACEVVRYSDGEDAIEALCDPQDLPTSQLPAIILLDLNLPRMDGLEILQRLRQDARLAQVPIAVLTSSHSPEDVRQAALAGATTYIRKPPALDEFLATVGNTVKELLLQRRFGATA